MNEFLRRMAVALSGGVIGLTVAFYSLERLSLINLATTLGQDDGKPPFTVQLALFGGLALLNVSLFYAVHRWSRFLRRRPRTPQAPVWLLIAGFMVPGAVMIWALATHAAWLHLQATVPHDVHWAYIVLQVICASLVLVSLVLLAARWSPGYKQRPTDPSAPEG